MRVCTADSSSTRRNTAVYSSKQQITVLSRVQQSAANNSLGIKIQGLDILDNTIWPFSNLKKNKFLLNKVFF